MSNNGCHFSPWKSSRLFKAMCFSMRSMYFNLAIRWHSKDVVFLWRLWYITCLPVMMTWFSSVQNWDLEVYPSIVSISFNASISKWSSLSQRNTAFQKSWLILQRKNRCSRDSTSSSQKVHKSESTRFVLHSNLLVYMMRWKRLNWETSCFDINSYLERDWINKIPVDFVTAKQSFIFLRSGWRGLFLHN